ncbi:AAA family ATPase [Oscillochloris sp. ZM17-4]|uniref:ATP-binding protein n=1 Tax=Oscillochloris sp. ZM17-4 TaxID=2866714 RepID=UPI001C734D9B|nr:AAA family ATPase [Oscillochloris sp. ZM17-4]MBX0327491.1 AAA family ATPase [Oscillochloris sp. ZM17-4]
MCAPQPLRLHLLGAFRIAPEQPAPALRRKDRALLAYLAITGKAQPRRALMDLFCQGANAPARALAVLLSRIRTQLGAAALLGDDESVRIDEGLVWVDVAAFQGALGGDVASRPIAQLEAAVALYRADLLDGLALSDAPEFELWLLGQRAHMRHLQERGLMALIERHIAQGQLGAALGYARQLGQHNPLLEEAHGQLIWLYAQTGQRDAALRQYEQCRALLRSELGVEPTDALQRLHLAVMGGDLARPYHREEKGTAPSAPLPAAGFVGRAAELAALHAAWRRAQAGQGGVIMIAARAGGGKTRLTHELTRHIPAASVSAGHCYESTRALAYQPWLEILESHVQRLDDATLQQIPPAAQSYVSRLLPGMARRLSPAAGASGVIDEPERLFTAVVDLLAHTPAGQPSPCLLLLDDLQWADEASLRLLHYVSQRIGRFPWLLIGTYRAEEAADTPALMMLLDDFARRAIPRLELGPLAAADIAALAGHVCPQLAPDGRGRLTALLARSTGGNALFVTAVLQDLAGAAQLPAELPVPAGVHDLVLRRLGRLPQSDRQVLETLAVAGDGLGLAQLQQLSARTEEETAEALERALAAGLVLAADDAAPVRYRFHHDLVREAVYATLSTVRRQRLHRRMADWLGRGAARRPLAGRQELAGRILYHALRGEAFDLAFAWAPHAAAHARQIFAYRDMMRMIGSMREAFAHCHLWPDFDPDAAEPELFDQLMWWLSYSWALGEPAAEETAALQQAEALLDRHPSPLRAAKLAFVRARMTLDYAEAIPVMLDAHRQFLYLEEPTLAALAMAEAASAAITLSRNREGRARYAQALALYREEHDGPGEIRCLAGLAWAALNLGEIALSIRSSQQALAISRARGDKLGQAQALLSLAAAWAFYCAPDMVEVFAAEARAIYEQIGLPLRAIRPALYIGAAHDMRGDAPAALAIYEDVLNQALAQQDTWVAGWAAQLAGRIELRRSRIDAAADRLGQARALRLQSGERQNQVSDLAWLGRLALAQGDVAAALERTAQAVALLDAFAGEYYVWEQPDVLMCRAEALAAAGLPGAALAAARRAHDTLRQFAAQIDDPQLLARFLAYPPNARVMEMTG